MAIHIPGNHHAPVKITLRSPKKIPTIGQRKSMNNELLFAVITAAMARMTEHDRTAILRYVKDVVEVLHDKCPTVEFSQKDALEVLACTGLWAARRKLAEAERTKVEQFMKENKYVQTTT
jgi:hypothetical protein